jgi:mannitol/fructose-specific phosphotransferase system IIA component (Ntr-type)/CBS domain-containing protein
VPDKGIKFSSLFSPQQVICGLRDVSSDEVVKRLIELVAATGDLSDIGEAYQLVLARERQGPTILAPGIAVPHARLSNLPALHVALATSRDGISFAPDKDPARLIVLILTPGGDPGGYLQAQAALARACTKHEGIVDDLAALTTPEEVWRLFDQEGARLPDYVSAGHMVKRNCPRLSVTDPLRKAIDEFCRLGVSELPVVDADGDLVGVVTEDQLLRVCLPEHLTWMEDLSPILHFEPFAQLLRSEGTTWLQDIMTSECATLAEEAPAIQVAKQMSDLNVRNVYVVRGKRLVGVITIQEFINKVLRD